jgi:hypothetical protein
MLKELIKKYSLDVDLYFSELIDVIIYYDLNEMDDSAYEIVGFIEELNNNRIFELLLSDLRHRKSSDFHVYFYCKLWWALIYEQDEKIINRIVKAVKENNNIMLHDFLIQSLKQVNDIDDDDDVENTNKLYIEAILEKIHKI